MFRFHGGITDTQFHESKYVEENEKIDIKISKSRLWMFTKIPLRDIQTSLKEWHLDII